MVGTASGLETVGGRVAAARRAAFIKNAAELARLVSARGYSVTRQTVRNIERDRHVPRPDLMEHIAAVLGVPAEQLRYGPREGESFRIEQLRALTPDLEDHQWERLVWLAQDMAAETRARRAAAAVTELRADEAELIEAYRAAQTDAARTAILLAARAASSSRDTKGEPLPTPTKRQRRRAAGAG